MENMSIEILDAICDAYNDDKDLVVKCLFYLYHNSTDDKLNRQIVDIMSEMGYCITCGDKLTTYEYKETHTELDYNNEEIMSAEICRHCDFRIGEI